MIPNATGGNRLNGDLDPTEILTAGRVVEIMLRRDQILEAAWLENRVALGAEADAEKPYRTARLEAWKQIGMGTCPSWVKGLPAKAKEDWVNGITAELRHTRDRAAAEAKSTTQAVYNRRQSMSNFQSIAKTAKEELEYGRLGPDV